MKKPDAIRLLGGSVASAAKAVGISSAAVSQWPLELPAAIADRVQAAIARRHLPPSVLGIEPTPAPEQQQAA